MSLSPVFYVISPIVFFLVSPLAQAQPVDYLCYWQSADGTTRDLGTLCQPQRPVVRLSSDDAFLANYQTLAGQYAAPLNQQLQQQARLDLLTEARVTCRILKLGGKAAEARRLKAIATTDPNPVSTARRQIVSAIAPTYYCPELADR